jgi:hypothetical protein
MRRLPLGIALLDLLGCLTVGALPALADRVTCGVDGSCFAASAGFSANCECKIRVVNGVAVCRPSGVCDPNDATSCKTNEFPQVIAAHPRISAPFFNDLAELNPLLAGAVWAGVSEANSALKGDRTEIKGTMGREGKTYTYLARVRLLSGDSVSFTAHVVEEGSGRAQDYEGTFVISGRSGRFVQVGPKGKTLVYSWDAH